MAKRKMNVDEYADFVMSAYNYYLENIRLAVDLYPFEWLHASEVNLNHDIVTWDIHNKYLTSISKDKDILARSILDIGMYFPLIIDSRRYIMEGLHRVMMLQLHGSPDTNKYLCLIMDEKKFDRAADITPKWDFAHPIYMPLERILQLKSTDELNEMKDTGALKFTNDFKFVELWTNDKMLWADYIVQYGCWLRDPFFNLEKIYGRKFIPSKMFNNEDYFRRHKDEKDWSFYSGQISERTLPKQIN